MKVLFPAPFNGELYAAMSTDTLRHACVCGLKGSKPQERNVSDYEEHLPEVSHCNNRLGVPTITASKYPGEHLIFATEFHLSTE